MNIWDCVQYLRFKMPSCYFNGEIKFLVYLSSDAQILFGGIIAHKVHSTLQMRSTVNWYGDLYILAYM